MPDVRLALTDQAISKLPLAAKGGQYRARDTALAGFMVLVGTRSKAFAIQAEFWREGVRELQVRIKLGEVGQISTRDARKKAKEALGCVARGERPGEPAKPVKLNRSPFDKPGSDIETLTCGGRSEVRPRSAATKITSSGSCATGWIFR